MLHSKSWINWSIIRQVGRHNSRHNLQRIRFARCGFLRPVLDVNKQYFTAIFEIACHLWRERQTRRASSPSFFETYEHSLFQEVFCAFDLDLELSMTEWPLLQSSVGASRPQRTSASRQNYRALLRSWRLRSALPLANGRMPPLFRAASHIQE